LVVARFEQREERLVAAPALAATVADHQDAQPVEHGRIDLGQQSQPLVLDDEPGRAGDA